MCHQVPRRTAMNRRTPVSRTTNGLTNEYTRTSPSTMLTTTTNPTDTIEYPHDYGRQDDGNVNARTMDTGTNARMMGISITNAIEYQHDYGRQDDSQQCECRHDGHQHQRQRNSTNLNGGTLGSNANASTTDGRIINSNVMTAAGTVCAGSPSGGEHMTGHKLCPALTIFSNGRCCVLILSAQCQPFFLYIFIVDP